MFTQFSNKTLFSKVIAVIVIAGFVLSSVPVSYANTDALRPDAGIRKADNPIKDLGKELKVTGPYDAEFPPMATFDDIGKTIDLRGKTVVYSPDVNVGARGGKITEPNHGRIVETAKNLKELLDNGAKVALIFHQGRPNDPAFIEDSDQIADILNRLVGGNRIRAVNDLFGPKAIAAIKGLKPGECVVLKQVRAKDPVTGKTLEESPWFVPTLRPLVDCFALGGLSALGGEGNRITGFHGVPTITDRLMVTEIQNARNDRNPLQPHLAVLGGSKVQKANAIVSGLNSGITDMVLPGGVPAEAVLVAAQMQKGKDYSEQELLALATEVLGPSAANSLLKADEGKFFAMLPSLATVIQEHRDKIAIPLDMAYMEGETPRVVTLVNGRVPAGFDHVLSGIGPQTDASFASIADRNENPFQSADLAGPLVDTRYKSLLPYMSKTAKAISQKIKVWKTGGGDIDTAMSDIGLSAPFKSFAGGARQDFLAGKRIPGIEAAINNSPEALKDKPFVPLTDEEAHILAHTNVFGSLAKAMQPAGGKLVARTNTFIRGQSVGTIKMTPTPMETVLRLSMGELANVFAGLQTLVIDGQNPWIDFSMTTLRTPTNDRRQINLDAVRQVLAADPNIAVILLQGEWSAKKAKFGEPGEVKTQSVEERLNSVLTRLLRQRGINPASMPKASQPLPTLVQVTESSIPGQLKMAVFVATPKSDIYRLMQLAQDSGINLKELFEQSKEINDPTFVDTLQTLKTKAQLSLLGEALPLPPAPQKVQEPDLREFAQLEGLTFGGAKINIKTQTILSKNPQGSVRLGEEILAILERVRQTGKLVRIMVPENSQTEQYLKEIRTIIEDVNFTMHSVKRGRDRFTAFIIAPKIPYVITGYGNEAIKVAPVLLASGFGNPAVAINSLDRMERVIHAFDIGYDVYHADQVQVDKETKKEGFLYEQQPQKLKEFEENLFKALVDACIAKARNELLAELPLSERRDPNKVNQVMAQAKEKGEREAREMFDRQYKGLLSVALKAGKFKVVVDATPEKIGAQNKKLLYEPTAKLYPDMVFIYQGGEEESVGYSFSNVSADYNTLRSQKHIRHISCNTTALTTLDLSLMDYLQAALSVDNLAIRRVADPGDMKGGVAATQLAFAYHHGPDLIATTPEELLVALRIPGMVDKSGKAMYYVNTDAAQTGGVTMYHHHILSLVRLDGKPLDVNEVKKALAARPDVALVDFPGGIFNGVRVVELSHNLLPQAVREAPDGANHVLVPVVTVQPTDDPAEVMMMIAVPQESIVARGQAHIIHAALGLASKDASTEIVDDAVGATELVEAIETRLPTVGFDQAEIAQTPVVAPQAIPVAPMPIKPDEAQLFLTRESLAKGTPSARLISDSKWRSPLDSVYIPDETIKLRETLRTTSNVVYGATSVHYGNFINAVKESKVAQALVVGANVIGNGATTETLEKLKEAAATKVMFLAEDQATVDKLKSLGVEKVGEIKGLDSILSTLKESNIPFEMTTFIISPLDQKKIDLGRIQSLGIQIVNLQSPKAKEALINSMPLVIARAIAGNLKTDDRVVQEFKKLSQNYSGQISAEDLAKLNDLTSQISDAPLVKTTEEVAKAQVVYEETVGKI